jgi:hypothetical protein
LPEDVAKSGDKLIVLPQGRRRDELETWFDTDLVV